MKGSADSTIAKNKIAQATAHFSKLKVPMAKRKMYLT